MEFGEPGNLELSQYIQHSDSIISWRGLARHWDTFQMCLNNKGIELLQKRALEKWGSNLLSFHFLETIFFFLLDRVYFSLSFFIFSSLYSLFSLFPSAHFLLVKLPFFPHSPLSHWSTTKMQDRGECEGGSGIPHAEGKHSNCQEDTHTQANTTHHSISAILCLTNSFYAR